MSRANIPSRDSRCGAGAKTSSCLHQQATLIEKIIAPSGGFLSGKRCASACSHNSLEKVLAAASARQSRNEEREPCTVMSSNCMRRKTAVKLIPDSCAPSLRPEKMACPLTRQCAQQRKRLTRQRHVMLPAGLHALRWNRPQRRLKMVSCYRARLTAPEHAAVRIATPAQRCSDCPHRSETVSRTFPVPNKKGLH